MVAYRGKSPKIRAFFKMLVYWDGRRQIGVKWHILAYAGISWHIIPCKSGKKSGKVRGRTTMYFTQFLTNKSLHNNSSKHYESPCTNLL